MFRLLILILLIFVACVTVECMPQDYKNVTTKRYSFRLNPERGTFKFRYVNSDGSYQEAIGLRDNDEDKSLTVIGFYGYTAPDGVQYRVSYVADKDGFRPEGDHIPTMRPDSSKIMDEVKRLVVVPSQKQARFRK